MWTVLTTIRKRSNVRLETTVILEKMSSATVGIDHCQDGSRDPGQDEHAVVKTSELFLVYL